MSIYKYGEVFSEKDIERLKDNKIRTVTENYAATTGLRGDEELQELVRRFAVPPLGGEYIFDVIGKYGHTISGICDGFKWDNLENLTEFDAYKIIAFCAIYWENNYKKWHREKEE